MMTTQMYDAQADSIKIEDITTDEENRIVLRHIMTSSNCADYRQVFIQNQHVEHLVDYVPEGAMDMGVKTIMYRTCSF